MGEKQREPRSMDESAEADHRNGAPATFTGDIRGAGATSGVDLGRGGTTTPAGDLAGGGEPGSLVDSGDGTIADRDALPTGGAGAAPSGQPQDVHGENAWLPAPERDLPRTATEMAPGIPTGSGKGIDEALGQPDSEIGGGVAGDTTPQTRPGADVRHSPDAEKRRELQDVRAEDKDRTTL